MSTSDKAIKKLLSGGVANLRLEEVLNGLDALGFDCVEDGNGHWQCRHTAAKAAVTVCPPHGGPNKVLPPYVREARKAARLVLQWKKKQQEKEKGDADS